MNQKIRIIRIIIYTQFLNDMKNDTPDGLYYYIKDIDGDSVKELLLLKKYRVIYIHY